MKKLLIVALVALTGCGINPVKPERKTVKEVAYIVAVPPKELTTLPEKVPDIDVDTADQAIVADWVLKKEKYTRDVEDLLIGVAEYLTNLQSNLDEKAKADNEAAIKEADAYDANAGKRASKKKVELSAEPLF